jgi:hypothetical protein
MKVVTTAPAASIIAGKAAHIRRIQRIAITIRDEGFHDLGALSRDFLERKSENRSALGTGHFCG